MSLKVIAAKSSAGGYTGAIPRNRASRLGQRADKVASNDLYASGDSNQGEVT